MASLAELVPSYNSAQGAAVSTRQRVPGQRGLKEKVVLSQIAPKTAAGDLQAEVDEAYAEMDVERKRLEDEIAAEMGGLDEEIQATRARTPSVRELVPWSAGVPQRKPPVAAEEPEAAPGVGNDQGATGPAMDPVASGAVNALGIQGGMAGLIGQTLASVVMAPVALAKTVYAWAQLSQQNEANIQAHRGTISSMPDPGAKGKRGMHDASRGFDAPSPAPSAGPAAGVGVSPGTQGGGATAGFGSAATPGNIGGGGHSPGGGGGGGGK